MKLFIKLNLGILFLALLALSSCRNPENEILPTCFDEIKNQGEERTDCGGPNCPPCLPSCDDFVQNQDELSPVTAMNPNVRGIDCGGENCPPCSTCDDGIQNAHWVRDLNLTVADLSRADVGQDASGILYRLVMESGIDCGFPCPEVCEATPFDGLKNGDEEGVDCGGSHPDADPCPPPTCYDGIQNGTETGVDCGDWDATCPECPDPTCDDGIQNIHIEINPDLPAGYIVVIETGIDCDNNPLTSCPDCPMPTCFDGIQNGTETGIDCGGNCYTLCDPEPNCNNGIQDGDETGVDCGGANCPPCATCQDEIKNGPEFAIDCLDYPIPGFEDCAICPSCHDGLQNEGEDDLFELDIDCGGPNCEPCDQFVTIASVGQGTGGSAFRDQYSYNKKLALSGMTDTLSLDHGLYPGLKITRVNYLGAEHLKIVANQGFALDANNTFIRTVTMFLPIPESDPDYNVNVGIPMFSSPVPQLPGYNCVPSFDIAVPVVAYQEKILQNQQADKCFVSYIEGTENSTLTFTYNYGGVTSLGFYTKGQINQGSMRTGVDFLTNLSKFGKYTDLKFKLQYKPFPG